MKVYICSTILCLLYSCSITRSWILYTKWYTLPHLLPSIFHKYFTLTSSIHGYETRYNKLCLTHVNTRFGQQILRYNGSQLWNRLPSNLTNSTASQSFWKKLKIVIVLWPNVMYCNEFFLDICHRDLLYFKPGCTHTVDLLLAVSALALTLHMLLFVPPVSSPSYLYSYLCSFVCLGGQFNERMLLWQPFER